MWLVLVVFIGGFLAAGLYAMRLSYKHGFDDVGASETDAYWAPEGYGTLYPTQGWPRGAAVPDCAIEYMSAYDPINTVVFGDPADAYEYVIGAVKFKNRAIDRLESSVYLGDPMNYEYLLIDIHRERDYWLTELHEYREDV